MSGPPKYHGVELIIIKAKSKKFHGARGAPTPTKLASSDQAPKR